MFKVYVGSKFEGRHTTVATPHPRRFLRRCCACIFSNKINTNLIDHPDSTGYDTRNKHRVIVRDAYASVYISSGRTCSESISTDKRASTMINTDRRIRPDGTTRTHVRIVVIYLFKGIGDVSRVWARDNARASRVPDETSKELLGTGDGVCGGALSILNATASRREIPNPLPVSGRFHELLTSFSDFNFPYGV